MNRYPISLLLMIFLVLINASCQNETKQESNINNLEKVNSGEFDWNTASIYFLLTDRFKNGDQSNDLNFERTSETGKLRGFMGGDIKGITQKINDGYFTDLGIDAIWFSPVFEQVHGAVDEGSGATYAFHGYWTKDWSALDPNFGTMDDLKNMIQAAHDKEIRILMDVIINHTGPVTDIDPVWPEEWVRTSPQCSYQSYETTANCTLVKNLPDVLTESDEEVELPPQLIQKWKSEGRYEQEMKELDDFFASTGLPRAPRYYIMKWLVDYINDFGIDGFRVDTVKHLHEDVFAELYQLAKDAFANWKRQNNDAVLDDNDFYMLGEVYGYGVSGKNLYNFGDRKVDYFANGFNSLINFEFVYDAQRDYEFIFNKYDSLLKVPDLKNKTVTNYISSHDDGNPYDAARNRSIESANKLLLTPGSIQIYYGDESARSLVIDGTQGDATLRSFMNWEDLETDSVKMILSHWQKLGQFRKMHPAIGAGDHQLLTKAPYTFSRQLNEDKVVIGLELASGEKVIDVSNLFEDGTEITDHYSSKKSIVTNGQVTIDSEFNTVLLQR